MRCKQLNTTAPAPVGIPAPPPDCVALLSPLAVAALQLGINPDDVLAYVRSQPRKPVEWSAEWLP